MADERAWRTLHRVVVVDCAAPRAPRVLVVPRAGGWALPEWEVEEAPTHDPDLGRLVGQVAERLGMNVGVLRYLEPREDEGTRRRSGTWVLERRSGAPSPDGARWLSPAELSATGTAWPMAVEALRDITEGISPPGRRAWSEPGWLEAAEAWMTAHLAALGRPATAPIEQVRNNSISSVLRARTARGDVYLKAAAPHFRHEARITRALAERFPAHLPRVLVADEARSWLLLEDFGPTLRHAALPEWEETLRAMGELQRRCVDQTEWLWSIGCADRRLAVLREQIPALLGDAPEVRAELDETLLARLAARVPELQAACDELAACGVPETLIHGDLHGGNVAHGGGAGVTIFDWTDAAVAHPFLDLPTFLPTERRKPSNIEDPKAAARHLLDAYLEGWTGYASVAQLRRAVELIKTVGQLHHAQSYLQILRSLEPADYWQWEGELGEWLIEVADPTRTMKDIFPA